MAVPALRDTQTTAPARCTHRRSPVRWGHRHTSPSNSHNLPAHHSACLQDKSFSADR